ncbi:MAG: PilX N-terminal domain-containing pilus assembly protein [Candidatus Binatia bacterium]
MLMKARSRFANQDGLVLATVLVFLLVLTLSAYFASMLSRTDVLIVNNEQNEKEAFYVAEAGITEALVRLGMATVTSVVANGGTFDASFTGANAPDSSVPAWKAQIVFGASAPSKSGNTVTTPSIQHAATSLPYTTASPSPESLTLSWNLCAAAGPGCAAPGAIRKSGGKNILDIISTGESGAARRRITQQVVFDNLSGVVLRSDICPGVRTQGSGAVTFPGGVQVNSTCADAIGAGGSSSITALGEITTSGSGYSGNITPTPSTGAPQVPDPLAALPPPSFAGKPIRGLGTAAAPATFQTSGTQTIQPGIYYGGLNVRSGDDVTMAPGVYVMAGGGFNVSANGRVTSAPGGVMIYNTCAVPPAPGVACALGGLAGYGAISISANRPITLSAPSAATDPTYAGIVIFQDRMNARPISITSGATGVMDGLIYAKESTITLSGGADLLHSQLVVGAVNLQGGPMIGEPSVWIPLGSGRVRAIAWQDF